MSKSIIVALDEYKQTKFEQVLDQLDPNLCMIKIGSVSFNSLGREVVIEAANKGFDVFLDLKLHDIPNTVKKSIEGLVDLPIKMMTVHTSGGLKMLQESLDAVKDTNIKIFGVTALTSLADEDTQTIYRCNAKDQVLAMLELAMQSGIHGVVCSPHELSLVKNNSDLLTITPGIRMKSLGDDQTRTMSPKEAIDNGSNFLVIGRPITASTNIKNSLQEIYDSIQ
ncbi:MAG: orotidine 5'-phosphate decarboxylase [SAR86 cluster bacterium SAR86B]|uniref:Orotidine 5'-phosphate decarboxylase n=1 Tax=SAR86 cluster bacterium SAR86B TaxID=1123867 RepID=J4X5V5_9GAMM|nr:MAG: orotidine 5'-phosphate decarboxylase [SAR86 cluster bacterium SAR86B]